MSRKQRLLPLFLYGAFALLSCKTSPPPQNFTEDKLYMQVIPFSDNLIDADAGMYENSDKGLVVTKQFIAEHLIEDTKRKLTPHAAGRSRQTDLELRMARLAEGTNTGIYYALDKALDRIQKIYHNEVDTVFSDDPNTWYYTKYYVILITDGLDNASVELARAEGKKYRDAEQYLSKLRSRLKRIFDPKRKNTFETYLLGLFGPDLKTSGYTKEDLGESLRPLMLSYPANDTRLLHEPIVCDISEDTSLEHLYDAFRDQFRASEFSFQIPKSYAEEKYRVKVEFREKGSKDFRHFFEADFALRSGKFYLRNITKSPGFSFEGGAMIEETAGNPEKPWLANFTIYDLRLDGRTMLIPEPDEEPWVRQWYWKDDGWRFNSEFQRERGRYQNACVLILLDRSKSLDPEPLLAEEAGLAPPVPGLSLKRYTEFRTIDIMRLISDEKSAGEQ
jgi:hypothetical protein